MLELSPLVTAANAPASLDAGLDEVVAVEAEADDRRAREVGRAGAGTRRAFLSTTATVWPACSRLPASSLPTRPQPTTTTCTAASLRRPGTRQATELAAERAIVTAV